MKKAVIILALVLTSTLTFAQDAPPAAAPVAAAPAVKFAAAVDVVAPYLWRGIALNSTSKVAFQPYASITVSDKFTFGVWGTTNLSNDATSYNEFDWYASYQVCSIAKVMLSDYYSDAPALRGSYFDYKSATQALDLSVLLNFSSKGVPLDLQLNTLIGGGDYKANGDRNFSTYAEAGYTVSAKSIGVDFRGFAGAVVNESGYYGTDGGIYFPNSKGFTFTNVGLNASKAIKISEKYSIPVFVRYTYSDRGNYSNNGDLKHSFIGGGATFTIK